MLKLDFAGHAEGKKKEYRIKYEKGSEFLVQLLNEEEKVALRKEFTSVVPDGEKLKDGTQPTKEVPNNTAIGKALFTRQFTGWVGVNDGQALTDVIKEVLSSEQEYAHIFRRVMEGIQAIGSTHDWEKQLEWTEKNFENGQGGSTTHETQDVEAQEMEKPTIRRVGGQPSSSERPQNAPEE